MEVPERGTVMKMAVVLGFALTLSAQPIEAPLLTQSHLNGRWWVQASQHDRLIYQMAFADGENYRARSCH